MRSLPPFLFGLILGAAQLTAGEAEAATFDPTAAASALSKAADAAQSCKKAGGPTGSVTVKLTFAPAGIPDAVVVAPPFAGTPVGECVDKAFRLAKIPPFEGAPVTAQKTFDIR
jgi:hypothetical protein